MSKLNAAKSIRNLASLYRDMEAAAEALEQIGSLDQAAEEAKKAVTLAQAELANLNGKKDDARRKVTEAEEKAEAIKTQAEQQVAETLRAAQERADATVANGRAIAEAAIAEAKGKAASAIAAAEDRIAVLRDTGDLVREEVAKLRLERNKAQDELIAIEDKLAAARDELRKLLG
jgi:predicted  nucleic acid-binding Zn-ribbon protein